MRLQLFLDGDKRTIMLVVNKELICSGHGIIVVLVDRISRLLIDFMELEMITVLRVLYIWFKF